MTGLPRPSVIIAAIVGFALASAPAGATLLSIDLFSDGDGLLTFDSDTNLEWLDMPETIGIAVSAVVEGLNPDDPSGDGPLTVASGVLPGGFRFATKVEVLALWDGAARDAFGDPNATITPGPSTVNFASATLMLGLSGCTHAANPDCTPTGTEFGYFGIYRVDENTTIYAESFLAIENNLARFDIQISNRVLDSGDLALPRGGRGQFLVRDAVITPLPEPATLSMVALALAFLGLRHARRRDSIRFKSGPITAQ